MIADPRNSMIFLTSKTLDQAMMTQREPWYGIDFIAQKFSAAQLDLMCNPLLPKHSLGLPPANMLLASNTILVSDENSKEPVKIASWPEGQVWFKHDAEFRRPKGILGLKIYTSDHGFGNCPKARVFAEVWHGCFNEYVREFSYMADCADLSFTWNLCLDNVEFEWSGFTQALPIYAVQTL